MRRKVRQSGARTVLVVTPRYLPLLGGMERECALLADEFEQMGYEVLVLTEQLGMDLPEREVKGAVEVIRIPSSTNRGILTQLGVAARLARVMLARRSSIAFCIVRTFTLPALLVGLLKKSRLVRFPTLVTAETGGYEDDVVALHRRPFASISKALVTSNDYLNGLCRINLDHMREFGFPEKKLTHIPNGIDVSSWDFTIPPERVSSFIFLGRIEREKGIYELLTAFARVREDHPGICMTIAGDGPARNAVAERIADLGLDDQVKMPGRVDHEQIDLLFEEHDCLVLPSYSEGMPLSVLEAAARRRVLVLSDVGDIREMFGDRAFICEPEDPESLEHEMRSAIASSPPFADYEPIIEKVAISRVAGEIAGLLTSSAEARRSRPS